MVDALHRLLIVQRFVPNAGESSGLGWPGWNVVTGAANSDAGPSLPSLLKGIYRLLAVICVAAILSMLYAAQAVFIPIALSLALGLLLRPAVRWFHRRHVPAYTSAFLCLGATVVAIAAGIMPLLGPAQDWMNELPSNLSRAREKLDAVREHFAQWTRVRMQIAELAASGNDELPPIPVTVREPDLATSAEALSITSGVVGMWVVVIVLTYFVLTSGDSLLNSVLTMLPTFREKRRAVELIKNVEHGVSLYLATVTMINVGLGVVVGITLWLMGVPNAAVWGLMAAVFNYVPFIGPAAAGLVIGLVAFLHFDSVGYALLVPAVFYSIAAVEGNLITPSLVGRHMRLNPALVLISLIGWGWMWGIAGAALAIPILAVLKIGCEHFGMMRGPAQLERQTL